MKYQGMTALLPALSNCQRMVECFFTMLALENIYKKKYSDRSYECYKIYQRHLKSGLTRGPRCEDMKGRS